jgi:hypothetical protein
MLPFHISSPHAFWMIGFSPPVHASAAKSPALTAHDLNGSLKNLPYVPQSRGSPATEL